MSPPHPLDRALHLRRDPDGRLHGHTDPAWANMVGPYGGITAAVLLQAALGHPERLGEPLALTVNYAAAVPDGPFEIEARAVRTNRSTQHWSLLLRPPGGEVATTATAVFALRRDTWAATEVPRPEAPPWDAVPLAPRRDGAPEWLQRYELRFVHGMPGAQPQPGSTPDSRTLVWIRDHPARALDMLSLAAICDNFAPRIMIRRPPAVPAGTVSISTYFHATEAQLAAVGDRPLLGEARAAHFGGGFHDQSARVWSDDGMLLASSHQVVYFKA